MDMSWTPAERELLAGLDVAVRRPEVRGAIDATVARVRGILERDPDAIEAWEPIPLETYGGSLPAEIRSSWVFILRHGVATGAERHPNSIQRMTSWSGGGDFQVHDGTRWRSHFLRGQERASLEERWISIPTSTWHQGVVGEEDWVVVSFQTAPMAELIEERPEPGDPGHVRSRRYAEVRQA